MSLFRLATFQTPYGMPKNANSQKCPWKCLGDLPSWKPACRVLKGIDILAFLKRGTALPILQTVSWESLLCWYSLHTHPPPELSFLWWPVTVSPSSLRGQIAHSGWRKRKAGCVRKQVLQERLQILSLSVVIKSSLCKRM